MEDASALNAILRERMDALTRQSYELVDAHLHEVVSAEYRGPLWVERWIEFDDSYAVVRIEFSKTEPPDRGRAWLRLEIDDAAAKLIQSRRDDS